MANDRRNVDSKVSYTLKAVIDVGSTSIRMVVAQVRKDGSYQAIESLYQSVPIGSDTFTRGRISRHTIEEAVKVMRSFSILLREYQIELRKNVRAVATSAVREARNSIEFLDRIYIATDIDVEVIEGTEVNRLTFLGIRPLLAEYAELQQNRLLAVEVGGGSTELLGLDDGRVSIARTYRMGTYRLRETLDTKSVSEVQQQEALSAEIDSGVRLWKDVVGAPAQKVSVLLLGGEARLAAQLVDETWDKESVVSIKVAPLARLASQVLEMDVEVVARKYHLSLEEAQTLGTALQIYVRMARVFKVRRLFVCGVTLRDGLLEEAAQGNAWTDDFVGQILHSVKEFGRKYQLNQAHADCVTENALTLFRAMQLEHRLSYHYEVILTVAAQLHDVGLFIGNSSHHKHSRYLIENSNIFGLGKKDIQLCALVARYHRRAVPRIGHSDYAALSRDDRLRVNKLAAILRVADALDRSHTQAIHRVKITPQERQVLIEAQCSGDFSSEKRTLAEKGAMFEQVFGRPAVLRTRKKQG